MKNSIFPMDTDAYDERPTDSIEVNHGLPGESYTVRPCPERVPVQARSIPMASALTWTPMVFRLVSFRPVHRKNAFLTHGRRGEGDPPQAYQRIWEFILLSFTFQLFGLLTRHYVMNTLYTLFDSFTCFVFTSQT